MSESIHTSDLSLDHDIELIEHEDSNAKYSTQTIRQKQGRQVISSFTTTSSSSEDIAAETGANGETTSGKKTTSTTTTTTHSKVPVQAFPSVGFYQGLGRLQAISGLGFAAFAFVHVIPPVLAAFGGVELANKTLIWGRVYYQTYGVELIAVFGTLGVHILTGLGRAAVRSIWSAKKYLANRNSRTVVTEQHEGKTRTIIRETKVVSSASSSLSSAGGVSPGSFPYNRLAGWILTPIVLGHLFTCRLTPLFKLQDSAIIDYSFITYQHRVEKSGIFYVPLIALLFYHMYSNGPVAFNTILPKGSSKRITASELIKSRPVRAVLASVLTTVGLVGLYRIISDPSSIPWQRQYAQLL